MAAVWIRARNDLRARWRGVLVLAVLIGIAGGIAMTAAVGARRTESSYERLLESSRAYHLEVQNVGSPDNVILDVVGNLPQVDEYTRVAFVPASKATTQRPPPPFSWNVSAIAMADPNLGRTIEIPRLIAGRAPNVHDPAEAVINELFARVQGVEVGDDFSMQLATLDEVLQLFGGVPPVPTGPMVTVRIVGMWRVPHDVSLREPFIVLTPAFLAAHQERAATLWGMFVRLRNEGATASFLEGARKIGNEELLSIRSQEALVAKVDRALGVQTSGLWILAGVVTAGGAVILGQALARWVRTGSDDHPTLRALGMTAEQRAASGAIAAVIVAVGASVVAVGTTLVGSFIVPIGFARSIEPDIGLFADNRVLGIGAVSVFGFVAAIGALAALLQARTRIEAASQDASMPSRVTDRLARGGLSPALVTGVRFALSPGRGRNHVPVRSVLAGTTLSIVAVVAAVLFGRSLDLMMSTPSAYGWNWDVVGFGGEDPDVVVDIQEKIAGSGSVGSFSRAVMKPITFAGDDIETISVEAIEGDVQLAIIEGRYPVADDEVALGTKTLRNAGLTIGDRAPFPGSIEACGGKEREGCAVPYRVVGRIVFWGEDADPDVGAAFSRAGQSKLRGGDSFTDFLIRAAAGVPSAALVKDLEGVHGVDATLPEPPTNIDNLTHVRSMPWILGGILAVLAMAILVHALTTCVRRHRRELAILKTLGFVRRQTVSTVAWQATTLTALSLAVGLPLGFVAGRGAWRLLADRLGVLPIHASPIGAVVAGSIGLILLANLVAALPGRAAARVWPAVVLRSE